jgi:hypothetical protein
MEIVLLWWKGCAFRECRFSVRNLQERANRNFTLNGTPVYKDWSSFTRYGIGLTSTFLSKVFFRLPVILMVHEGISLTLLFVNVHARTGRLSGPQIWSVSCGEEKSIAPTGNQTPAVHLVAHYYTDWVSSALNPFLFMVYLTTLPIAQTM